MRDRGPRRGRRRRSSTNSHLSLLLLLLIALVLIVAVVRAAETEESSLDSEETRDQGYEDYVDAHDGHDDAAEGNENQYADGGEEEDTLAGDSEHWDPEDSAESTESKEHASDGSVEEQTESTTPSPAEEAPVTSADIAKDHTALAQDALSLLRSLSPKLDAPSSGFRTRSWNPLTRLVGPLTGLTSGGPRGSVVASIAKLEPSDELPVVATSDRDDVKRAKALRSLEILGLELGNEEALFVMAELNFFAPFGHPRNVSRSFELYSICSERHGNATAQGMVGFMYSTGIGAPEQNQAKAMLYYTFAALGQDPSSEMALGYRYLAGIGTQKNCDEAVWYYRKAAQKTVNYWLTGPPGGHVVPASKHRLSDDDGGTYGPSASGAGNPNPNGRNSGDGALTPDDVLQYWQYTAERGDPTAQFLLGQLYHGGTAAVVQDFAQALKYFSLAALQYDPPGPNPNGGPVQITQAHAQRLNAAAQASGQLGQMYFRGEGVAADNTTARRWFEKGAQHNEATSLNGLGLLSLEGTGGLPKDLKRAYQYFLKAAEQNNANAQANLGELYLRQGQKEYTNALKYFTLASRQGHLLAMFRLGDMYLEGHGTQANCMVAAAFFKSVSERGDWHDPLLEDALDAYYDEDMETAFLEYALSAERGYEVAQSNAAWMIDQGIYPAGSTAVFGASHDPWATALVYWNRAANQGNVDARVKVGDYYYYGLGHQAVHAAMAKAKNPVVTPPVQQQNTLSAAPAVAESTETQGAETSAEVGEKASPEPAPQKPEVTLPPPQPVSVWSGLVGTLLGWPRRGAPNYERAAMYYQTAADSEHSSLAMWNLAWMHECGVGVERDFHLAKRYYDRSLTTNPEGYLPVTIALSKLRVKQFFFSIFGFGGSSGAGKKASRTRKPDQEQIVVKVDSLPAPGEKQPEVAAAETDGDNDNWEWWDKFGGAVESTTENVLILVLMGVLGLLFFVRMRHGQWRGGDYRGVAPALPGAQFANINGNNGFGQQQMAGAGQQQAFVAREVPIPAATPSPSDREREQHESELRQRRTAGGDNADGA